MKNRIFKKPGIETSVFGMGCMRLPLNESGKPEDIDEPEAINMIRYAIDHGVTYIDTAYPYHNGKSEFVVGKALKDGYRRKTKLATKSPVWLVKEHDDFERYLDEQLERLQTDYVDFYLLHAMSKERWEKMKELDAIGFLRDMKKKGKIKYCGFSFHDNYDTFQEIIDYHDWDMCQIQLSYYDQEYQAGLKGLKYAHSKDIPVVVMEPLRGGQLADVPSSDIMDLWESAETKRNPVEWAFSWLYNFEEVNVILSGVSTMDQLKENVKIFEKADPNTLGKSELKLIEQVRKLYIEKIKIKCTGCDYCNGCPQKVAISMIFDLYNKAHMYSTKDKYAKTYREFLMKNNNDASQCVECGLCESLCPQNIPIIRELKRVHAYFTE